MSTFSDALELAILNLCLNATSYVYHTPGTQYLALLTTNPSDDAGTGLVEQTGTGYARSALEMDSAGGTRTMANTNAETFTASAGDWGDVTGVAIYSTSGAGTGNLLAWKSVTTKPVGNGDTYTVAAGALTISISASGGGGGMPTAFVAQLLDYLFRGTAFSGAYSGVGGSEPKVAAYTVTPSDSSAGTEATGGSYARVQMEFDAASAGVASNTNQEDMTASGAAWGDCVSGAICVGSTPATADQMFWFPLSATATIGDGDTLRFAAGAVDCSVD